MLFILTLNQSKVKKLKTIRIYINEKIQEGNLLINQESSHYLKNVMRLKLGDAFNVFNQRDGEWSAILKKYNNRKHQVLIQEFLGNKKPPEDIWILFSPVRKLRVDFISQKITELGASLIWPIITKRTQYKNINTKRIISNTIEAAEQCGITHIPVVKEPTSLEWLIDNWENSGEGRGIIFCDEESSGNPLQLLRQAGEDLPNMKWSILIGPEGGFDSEERKMVMKMANVVNISLGPRILRSDTAIIAALSAFHLVLGDWKGY